MGHGHGREHGHGHGSPAREGHGHGAPSGAPASRARRALALALTLTVAFLGVELVAGWMSGSLALLADAGHMASDSAALLLSYWVARIAERPRDEQRTYGYVRAEVIGALANAIVLGAACFGVVVEGAQRLLDPPAVAGGGVLVTAALGLAVNLAAAWILSRSASNNINVRGALFHVLGDALGSVAALIAGVLLVTLGWRLADPIASLVIAAMLAVAAVRLLRESTHVLMEGTPPGFDVHVLEATIRETEGVSGVHDLHVWCLAPGTPMLTAHVSVAADHHGTAVARLVVQRLRAIHGITHVTIQPEASDAIVPLRLGRSP